MQPEDRAIDPTDPHSPPWRQRLESRRDDVVRAVGRAVEAWNGEWNPDSGRLEISIRAGLRVGRWYGRLDLAGSNGATHLSLTPERAEYQLDQTALLLLSLAGLAAIPLLLWPFFPRLLSLLPVALLLAVGGWFLVISRLQNQGAEEFLDTVAHLLEDD